MTADRAKELLAAPRFGDAEHIQARRYLALIAALEDQPELLDCVNCGGACVLVCDCCSGAGGFRSAEKAIRQTLQVTGRGLDFWERRLSGAQPVDIRTRALFDAR